jgi:hypothetical protein
VGIDAAAGDKEPEAQRGHQQVQGQLMIDVGGQLAAADRPGIVDLD